ncbi:hypothetical protein BX616_001849 [Lobosporangium transversale]|uniref:N-acetyltransferase domain-containing protein n=1 Tax=Lobosporangium transversale TaxID=64571 RepID=A0A1Y2GKD5_9FUNG|nr:hypothetical protein BCR41DRAFT_356527 [Lobosporangium transversale]KAF9902705.1 hypothetical protein BX616_001849 [Lobosporangium transversale]ORZ12127.1 hypothetical protein BCR41DRAFT_356527 [Lobosporangium transversale]|eukprot:XP_021879992.1 hypothetical protein BCR41DRAFT_356527 [Lobosporangium transversale]
MATTFFVVDPQYIDGTELSLSPLHNDTSTSIIIWRLVCTRNGASPRGLYLPLDKTLVVKALSELFPQLSTSCTAGPDIDRIEACLTNEDTFTLLLATETLETITLRQPEINADQITLQEEITTNSNVTTMPTTTAFEKTSGSPKVSFKITKIVGCLTLVTLKLLMNNRAHIEDLVVSDICRGKGVGRGLMKRALDEAVFARHCKIVDLTSKPDRVQARALYESLGFKIRDTGAFRYYATS